MQPESTLFLSLAVTGFVLGWSVAWPPGPVNAEIVRRGLTRGFWPAWGLALGGCTGDAVWALAVALGAGVLLAADATRDVLLWASSGLLVVLGVVYLRGAAVTAWTHRDGRPMDFGSGSRFESARSGYLLGVTLTLTSPWSIAFWLAVMGREDTAQAGVAGALVLALAVIAGAATWSFILSSAVVLARHRFTSPWWDVFTRAATGVLLLWFAWRSIGALLAAN
ncbi:hypothetical protein GCM10011505_22480 [Tistrella bauzanensis]|uniref:Lysine transporter LysE n=1 Tax=Tistrella bauzanensis TaxID=657419 RepID=A0ABQ1IKJ1_9PROT|nr:LysE family transporter [Tistrella bauzanensis]GGB40512.1 hypothetical protein GCM10011505_22480 [Tistrella bauzanensis]